MLFNTMSCLSTISRTDSLLQSTTGGRACVGRDVVCAAKAVAAHVEGLPKHAMAGNQPAIERF